MPGDPVGAPLPLYTAVVEKSGPPWRVMGVVLAAFAVLCGSVFGYLAITRPDGEATPEAAVQKLFAAIDAEDAIGVLETLPPSERDVIKQPTIDIVHELQRLGILKAFEMHDVPGAELRVEGLQLVTEPVGVNADLSAVRVTGGTISGTVVPDAVPLGDRLRNIITNMGEPIEIEATSSTENLAKDNLRLITVKENGGWHVSLFYSIAEAIRDEQGAPPVLGNGPVPVGAATPEGAVTELAREAMELDLAGVISMLPPDEMRAVYDYAPLFLPDANRAADDVRRDNFSAKLDHVTTRVEGDGDVRRVFLTAFDVTIGDDSGMFHAAYDGRCITYDMPSFSYSTSTGDDGITSSGGSGPSSRMEQVQVCFDGSGVTTNGTSLSSSELGGFGDLGMFNGLTPELAVTVVERDGRWYVSPTRTLFDQVVTSLRKITPEQLDAYGKSLADQQNKMKERLQAYEDCPSTRSGRPPSSSSDSPYRYSYLQNKVLSDCLRSHGVDLPNTSQDDCFDAYEKLGDQAPESDWQAADQVVEQCMDDRYGTPSGRTPPGTIVTRRPPGTSPTRRTPTPTTSPGVPGTAPSARPTLPTLPPSSTTPES